MTTIEQKQQAAIDSVNKNPDYSTVLKGVKQLCPDEWEDEWYESYGKRKKREADQFIAGAEWAEAQQKWIPVSAGAPKCPEGDKAYKTQYWIIRHGRRLLATWDFTYECWCSINEVVVDDTDMPYKEQPLTYVEYYTPVNIPSIPPALEGEQDRPLAELDPQKENLKLHMQIHQLREQIARQEEQIKTLLVQLAEKGGRENEEGEQSNKPQ